MFPLEKVVIPTAPGQKQILLSMKKNRDRKVNGPRASPLPFPNNRPLRTFTLFLPTISEELLFAHLVSFPDSSAVSSKNFAEARRPESFLLP